VRAQVGKWLRQFSLKSQKVTKGSNTLVITLNFVAHAGDRSSGVKEINSEIHGYWYLGLQQASQCFIIPSHCPQTKISMRWRERPREGWLMILMLVYACVWRPWSLTISMVGRPPVVLGEFSFFFYFSSLAVEMAMTRMWMRVYNDSCTEHQMNIDMCQWSSGDSMNVMKSDQIECMFSL